MSKRLGILLSGRGSNFLAIHHHIQAGELQAEIACVISDNLEAPGLAKAQGLGLPAYHVNPAGRKKVEYESEILAVLRRHQVELVCLAGYMRIVGPTLLREFSSAILNIHPALLPAFPGLHAQRQALEYGVKVSGCTVHIVDAGMDTGPIVAQRVVPVLPEDTEETLADRILEQEHQLYSTAIQEMIENKYFIDGRRFIKKK